MGKSCVVCDYKFEKRSSRSLHKFPSNALEKNIWCKLLNLSPQNIFKEFLCSEHFAPSSFNISNKRTRLFKGAVPLPIRSTVENDSPEDDPYYMVKDEDNENLTDNVVSEVELFKKPRLDSPISVLSITSGKESSSTVTCSETEVQERKLKSFNTRKTRIKAPKAKLLTNKLKKANNMIINQKKTIRKLKKENYLLRGRLQSLNATFSYLKNNSFLNTEKIIVIYD